MTTAKIPSVLNLNCIVSEPFEQGGGIITRTLPNLLGLMLSHVEDLCGERDYSYTLLGIEFADDGPYIWYPYANKQVLIRLGTDCLSNLEQGYYQLAHEAVHLISPSGGRNANFLEEGVAEYFAQFFMLSFFHQPWHNTKESYMKAATAVGEMLTHYPDAIRTLRKQQPTLSKITVDDLRVACPDLHTDIIEYLCSPFLR